MNDVRHEYYLDGSRIIKETWANQALEFLYDENGSVYCIVYTGGDGAGRYYLIKNLQGDVTRILNNNLETVAQYVYDPWGKLVNILDANGEPNSGISIANINPIRYRGYYFDMETGFYYVSSRYYDPEIGRWINADTSEALTVGFENFVQYNLFAYCFNNPVNMTDETGAWPSWVGKVVAAVAVVAVVAAVAAITVATAGAGTAAAVIAVGAAKGAAIGMISGAAMGAATGAVRHRVSTGSWNGAGTAALNGMGDGALSGAITGAITGAVGSALKVGRAARAWDSSSKGGPWTNMNDHYKRHVIQEGKKAMTKNVITYTDDAVALWNKCNGIGKLMDSGSLRLKGLRVGGFYSKSGLIRSFFYQ